MTTGGLISPDGLFEIFPALVFGIEEGGELRQRQLAFHEKVISQNRILSSKL